MSLGPWSGIRASPPRPTRHGQRTWRLRSTPAALMLELWDQKTGRSRGYGFVSFRNQQDAQSAINDVNGLILFRRIINSQDSSRWFDIFSGKLTVKCLKVYIK